MRCFALIACALIALTPAPAQAYCQYRGVMYARTTLAQEFRDSRWVVRVRVLSAIDHWSDTEQSWTLYRLEVLRRYKGSPPRRIVFFTERNSGAFYMDRPWAGHDIGGEYLLFLTPLSYRRGPPEARRALWINYECGQSRPWAEVSASDRRRLGILAAGRRVRSRRT